MVDSTEAAGNQLRAAELLNALRIVSTGFSQMAIILSVDILRCTIDVAILWPDVKERARCGASLRSGSSTCTLSRRRAPRRRIRAAGNHRLMYRPHAA